MGKISILIGALLIVLGVGFYFGTGMKSLTAMIPAFFGLPVAVLGAVAAGGGDRVRMHTMHVAVLITLVGGLGGLMMGLRRIGDPEKVTVVTAQLIMAALCAAHVVLSVRSFIAARKARQAEAAAPADG